VPRTHACRARGSDRRGGSLAPDVGDGRQDHDRLGNAHEQGTRADGGSPPVRHAVRANRCARAPAVARPRRRRARRWRDARAPGPARHAHRDLLRAARRRKRRAADHRARPRRDRHAEVRSGRRGGVPVPAPRRQWPHSDERGRLATLVGMSWALTIFGIVLLIILHELGHFAVAKAVGMRVERFSLFFPPKLASVRRGETEYAIGALPLGGYVRITGMTPEELRTTDARVAVRGFSMQPPWKRVVVILAGPVINVLIAFVLFAAVLLSGNLNGAFALEDLVPSVRTVVPSTSVAVVESGSPAAAALK